MHLNDKISFIGYPFSISENFQIRNTNKSIHDSEKELAEILEIAETKKYSVFINVFGNLMVTHGMLKLLIIGYQNSLI